MRKPEPRNPIAAWMTLLLLTLAACAPARTAAGETGALQVIVENNLLPSSSVTVWLVPEAGARQLLGTVSPQATQTFRFDPRPATQYRFRAQPATGVEVVSRPFSPVPEGSLRWEMNANQVIVTGPGGMLEPDPDALR